MKAKNDINSDSSVMKYRDGKYNKGQGTARGGNNKIKCYSCGIPGHKSTECRNKEKKWCPRCKSKSHTEKACRRTGGDGDDVNRVTTDDNHTYAFKIGDNKDELYLNVDKQSYLVDCGATTHIVNSDADFIFVDESFKPEEHYIELADGTRSNNVAKKRGTVKISLRSASGDLVNCTLDNALYVPSYPQCIFSVQAATRIGAKVTFDGNTAELVAADGTRFPIQQHGRLYYLFKNSVDSVRTETLDVWHKIMGHCNVDDLNKLEAVSQGMKIRGSTLPFNCETCTVAKQTNVRNRTPDVRATYPFELVHTDLAGPIDPIAKDGFKYTIIFTDDFSGCYFTYFLKNKSDAVKATRKFFADIAPYGKVNLLSFYSEISPTGEVVRLRSDNGGEYLSADYKDLLLKHSVKHEMSCPHSPHQNGTAERSWRTLFDMTRCLLVESRLPKYLWTYGVMISTHIRNRCYSKRIHNTPYGLITTRKPDINNLHIFGTVCYAYVHNAKKLEPRCRKGYFIGYDKDSPAYLVYYPETSSVRKHRIVKFTDLFEEPPNDGSNEQLIEEGAQDVQQQNLPEQVLPTTEETLRRSRREKQPPPHLKDFVTSNAENDTAKLVHYCYVLKVPSSFTEAVKCDDADHWKEAMDEEMKVLKENDTYILAELPQSCKSVGGRWVYAVKGEPDKVLYKARYVAKGCSQVYGVDYLETFSPTPRMESLRIMMHIAAQYDLSVHQMDVKGAYLHAPIECDIYVNQPPGYEELAEGKRLVWKLKKSLYGLKQSGRNWHAVLHEFLLGIDFHQSTADPCVFIRNDELFILLVFVDDIILATQHDKTMNNVKDSLKSRFTMKDLGPICFFLGIQFTQNSGEITMCQSTYLMNILDKFGMADCKPRATPSEMKPSSSSSENTDNINDEHKYREMIGSLVYAMTCSRPDLSYVVTKLSQHLSCPNESDWVTLKHVFQYIKGTLDLKISFRKSDEDLKLLAYCDADWASSLDERRSVTGYCFLLSDIGPVISWKSKKQQSVALSTCEAEYMSLSSTCQEVAYLTRLLNDILNVDFEPVEIKNDNQGTIALAKNPVKHHKSKHIDIRYHFIRDYLREEKILISYVPSQNNLADVFTKPSTKAKLEYCKPQLFGN